MQGQHHANADAAQFCAEIGVQIAIRLRIRGTETLRRMPPMAHHR